ncbi:MAG: magnesium-transporting ATPase (P-type) [Pirellulaceae bacterium]|jgi:magnesium-transporting ATPase (P-type)
MMLPSLYFGIPLFVVALLMLFWHYSKWNRLKSQQLGDHERDFYQRQFRRRIQGSIMIGIVAVMVVGEHWIGDEMFAAIYWAIVLVLVLWMVALAIMDSIASRGFFELELNRNLRIQETLQAEIRRYREEHPDGDQELNPDDPATGEIS